MEKGGVMDWLASVIVIFTFLGWITTLWFFKDRIFLPLYSMIHKRWSKFVNRRKLIVVTISKGDRVRVRLLKCKYPRDLGPIGNSWQDPHICLLEWYNGIKFIPVQVGFKAVLSDIEGSVPRYLGDPYGEGMFFPNRDNMPEQCWHENFLKNRDYRAWAVLKKLIVFETFVKRYLKTPLEADVIAFSKTKDGFLHLRNEKYEKTLKNEYDVCIPLMTLFQNEGLKWIEQIQKIPAEEIFTWITQKSSELRGWIFGKEINLKENELTEERLCRVLVSLLPHHILKELYRI